MIRFERHSRLLLGAGATVCVLATSLFVANSADAKVQVLSNKTEFGYINTAVVKAPKGHGCIQIPVVVDVRNPDKIGGGTIQMQIYDDFSNLVAFTLWTAPPQIGLGKYRTNLEVCGKPHIYQFPTIARTVPIKPYVRGAHYMVQAAEFGPGSPPLGDYQDYDFK